MKAIIEPVESVDIHTEQREQLFRVSLVEKPRFRSQEEAERVATEIEKLVVEEV